MLIDSRAVALTERFYRWELRGRGWATSPYPVELEPPFRPFRGYLLGEGAVDDGKRHTWLSRLLERPKPEVLPAVVEESEDESEELAIASEPEEWYELLVSLPESAKGVRAAQAGWLRSLTALSRHASFELIGRFGRVDIRLALQARDVGTAVTQLRAFFPDAVVLPARETLEDLWISDGAKPFTVLELGLASEFMVPLAVAGGNDEPLLPAIAALADLSEGELGIVQVLFEPTRAPWPESTLRVVTAPNGGPFFADAPEITNLAREKLASPLFAVALRIFASADRAERAWNIVCSAAAGLAPLGNPRVNELMPLHTEDVKVLEWDLRDRTTHRTGMLLSADELLSLIQLPGAGVKVPKLWRARERTKRAPAEATGGVGCFLGDNVHHDEPVEVRLPNDARSKHVHVLGASGTGKSTLLKRMILDDIEAGHGVGILDPHGDLVDEIAGRIPECRLPDVVYLDPSREESSIGWNILRADSESEKELLASDLVGVFRRLSTSWGDQMTAVLGNAILVFLESSRGGTLEDLRRFLVDAAFRKEFLGTVADDHVRSFWETEFALLAGRKPQAPILTRLDTFLRPRLVRRMVAVRKPRLDFREVTDHGLILLGKLSAGAIGEDNAALLGSLLVSKLHQVTLSRAGQKEKDRRPFYLYIDEFHHVATPSMASLFSGARKYRLGLTVAHQDLYQLHRTVPEVERSLLSNAYTRICFRLGDEDARQMAKGFAFFEAEDLMRLGRGEAICRVGGRDGDFNLETRKPERGDPEGRVARRWEVVRSSASRWRPVDPDPEDAGPTSDGPDGEDPSGGSGAEHQPPPVEGSTARVRSRSDGVGGSSAPTDDKGASSTRHASASLTKLDIDYLTLAAQEPFLNVRQRNDRLGLSPWKGNETKKRLVKEGFAEEVTINPGWRGGAFQLLDLTSKGRSFLAKLKVKPASGLGRGGLVHQWWVSTVAETLRDRGLEAKIEEESSGARVDIAVEIDGVPTAVEVEVSEGHELENIEKDLAAGYERVLMLVDRADGMDRLRARVEGALGGGSKWGFELHDLRDFEHVLDRLVAPPVPEGGSSRVRRRDRSPATSPAEVTSWLEPEPNALSTPEAASYVGLRPTTLEGMRVRGGGPGFAKLGRRVVYRKSDLDEWLEARRRKSTTDPGQGGE